MKNDYLAEFLPRRIGVPSDSNIEELLFCFEIVIAAKLPQSYTEFIKYYQSTIVFELDVCFHPLNATPWDKKDGTQDLELLYGIIHSDQNLHNAYKTYATRMPSSIIPIGEASGGNLICLDVSNEHNCQVYFWDHENECLITGSNKTDYNNLYLIAETFPDFLSRLQTKVGNTDKSGDGIVGVWLSDDL